MVDRVGLENRSCASNRGFESLITRMAVDTTYYRLAPHVRVRFVGLYLVALAVIVFALSIVLVALNVLPDLIVVAAIVGIIGLVGFNWWLTKKAWVFRASAEGYEIKMVRSPGLKAGRWATVQDAVTASPHGHDCLVLRHKAGETTSIPVELLAVDQNEFVREIQKYLQQAQTGK